MRWLASLVLALSCVLGVAPQDDTFEIHGMKQPALSADGAWVAFSWHGDIWMAPAQGGRAVRVTSDPADEQSPTWAPDGSKIAFSSDKFGNRDIFVIDVKTKAVTQITYHSADDDCPAWSPDGQWIAFQSNRNPNVDQPFKDYWSDIYVAPAAGGTARRVTLYGGEHPAWSEDSRTIAFDRYSSGYGDGEHHVDVVPLSGGVPREIASGPQDSRSAAWFGDQVYMEQASRTIHAPAVGNVWRVASSGGPLFQVTGLTEGQVRWPTIARHTGVMVFELGFDLYTLSLKDDRPRPRRILCTLPTDPYPDNERKTRAVTAGARSPALSPDGKMIACIIEGDVWVLNADGTGARPLTSTLDEERDPSWSSDGKRVIFVRAPYGQRRQIFSVTIDGKETKLLVARPALYATPRLSPDGSRLAFTLDTETSEDLYVTDVTTDEVKFSATSPQCDESFPAFSPDGTRLAYLRFDPVANKTAFVIQGAREAAKTVHEEAGRITYLDWSRNAESLAFCDSDDDGLSTLCTLKLDDGTVERFPRSHDAALASPSWAPDNVTILCEERRPNQGLEDDRSSRLLLRDTRNRTRSQEVSFSAQRTGTLRDEMLSAFLEAWGIYNLNFYDPFFHGMDWNKVRERYAPIAAACRTRAEITALINDMIRELRASHVHYSATARENTVSTGSLGADWEVVNEGLCLKNVDRAGPTDGAGLKEGDVVIAIDGHRIADADRPLTVEGKRPPAEATLTLASGKRVAVKPISLAQLRELKYDNLIQGRADTVKEKSKGRLAYHHLKFMQAAEVKRLQHAIGDDLTDVEGLVLDARDGFGGLAHWQVLSLLDSRVRTQFKNTSVLYMRYRSGRTVPDYFGFNAIGGSVPEDVTWKKPVVLVQNEVSRSDKEILAYTFRKAGLGYTVGMPTAGGVIGGYTYTTSEGSRAVVSLQGWFTSEGANMEGYRVPPDVMVPYTPADYYAHRDPQLEKSVEVLLAQMEGKIPAPK